MEHLQSRRDFLKTSAKMMAGVALVSAGHPLMNASAEAIQAAPFPFPYSRIDPDKAEERGYKGYYEKGGCARGAADALIGLLADDVGYPFNQIPIDMFANGATGYGAGSLCGSLAGAVNMIGLVCQPDDAKKLTQELFAWYREAELPIYQPNTKSVTTVAKSVNCMESVSHYMEATGAKMGDTTRKERCAGVTADTAKKTAELLNAHFGV
ncbi:MAG: C_GCAxxG_C_C family protein [Clostridiales bacterium]|nr:C_GCAxxG_C_C family protein [Clostridiales bacterium]